VDDLSLKIRRARNEAGLSRELLAGKVGVSLATVVRYETGRTQRVSLELLVKIAEATGKPLVWFFENDSGLVGEVSHG
jgi:transcriptional regulator with XRE-family HTH domain